MYTAKFHVYSQLRNILLPSTEENDTLINAIEFVWMNEILALHKIIKTVPSIKALISLSLTQPLLIISTFIQLLPHQIIENNSSVNNLHSYVQFSDSFMRY